MFWNFLFAHFLADYPLQSNWMVRNKLRPLILAVHAIIQLAVMLLVVYPATRRIWPWLVVLAVLHYGVDITKITFGRFNPRYVVVPYLLDQLIHYGLLLGAAWWFAQMPGVPRPYLSPQLAILGTAFVFVTHVWQITERVVSYAQPAYVRCILAQANGRMMVRAGALAVLLLAVSGVGIAAEAARHSSWTTGSAMAAPVISTAFTMAVPVGAPEATFPWVLTIVWIALLAYAVAQVWNEAPESWRPYQEPGYRRRVVLTDLAVVVGAFLFTLLAGWTV